MAQTEKKRSRGKRRYGKLKWGLLTVLLLAGIAGGWFYVDSLAYKTCRVEAGVEVGAFDFMKNADVNAFFTTESQPFDITQPGEYPVKVKSGWFTHACKLIVQDTIAPSGEPCEVLLEMGETCDAEAFVTQITDVTEVTVDFVQEPDFTQPGRQQVQILLTDLGGNIASLESELFISQVRRK